MDAPDIMSPLQQADPFFQNAFAAERDYTNAINEAVRLHCRGQYIPEDIARFCRTLAINLDRDLARMKGEPLPELHYLEDYLCDTRLNCTPANSSSNAKPATEIGMGYPGITT